MIFARQKKINRVLSYEEIDKMPRVMDEYNVIVGRLVGTRIALKQTDPERYVFTDEYGYDEYVSKNDYLIMDGGKLRTIKKESFLEEYEIIQEKQIEKCNILLESEE